MIRSVAAALALAMAAVAAPAFAGPFDAALAGAHRSDADKARDPYRHPAQTLEFFGVVPGKTVVEISPGGGWYTDVIAPGLKESGVYYAALGNPEASEAAAAGVKRFADKMAAKPEVYGAPRISVFSKAKMDVAPAGTADVVLTFRNIHNWYMADFAPEAFKAFFAALKPGGTLGVVEHRLPEDRPDAMMKSSGYMKVSAIKAMAEAAGFVLEASSEVNANPKDTADYPGGVWTLPPTFAEKDKDREKFAAIGESDRMTLKFVKPMK